MESRHDGNDLGEAAVGRLNTLLDTAARRTRAPWRFRNPTGLISSGSYLLLRPRGVSFVARTLLLVGAAALAVAPAFSCAFISCR